MNDKTIEKLLRGLAKRSERAEGRRERRGKFSSAVVASAQQACKDYNAGQEILLQDQNIRYEG